MDTPIPLQRELQQTMGINAAEYNLFFSFYALPNIVLPYITGILADVLGRRYSPRECEHRHALIISGGVLAFGQLLLALGVSADSFRVSLCGRFFFGYCLLIPHRAG